MTEDILAKGFLCLAALVMLSMAVFMFACAWQVLTHPESLNTVKIQQSR